MKWFLLALNLSLHAAFIWGRYIVFRVDGAATRGVRIIEFSTALSLIAGGTLITLRPAVSLPSDLLAVACAVLSGAVFAWGVATIRCGRLTAAFSDDAPAELITSGPFRFVRNPFYLSYLLAYLQAVLASQSPWSMLPLLGMWCIYRRAAGLEEQKFERSHLAKTYRSYAACTGRFLPWRGGSRDQCRFKLSTLH
jgi:protein-S-isoprenylcysteine O-methyltransferase Ste14